MITRLLAKNELYLICNVHTPRCLALHFWELLRNKKMIHVDTYMGFLQLSGGKKAIFLASILCICK